MLDAVNMAEFAYTVALSAVIHSTQQVTETANTTGRDDQHRLRMDSEL